jgi:anti-sigma28 factor (negative regulator of flagellin synthesis)
MDFSSIATNSTRPVVSSAAVSPSRGAAAIETESASAPAGVDQVELSPAARLYSQLPEQPFRADKVADIKQRLADGTYLSPEQTDKVLDGLLRDLDLLA